MPAAIQKRGQAGDSKWKACEVGVENLDSFATLSHRAVVLRSSRLRSLRELHIEVLPAVCDASERVVRCIVRLVGIPWRSGRNVIADDKVEDLTNREAPSRRPRLTVFIRSMLPVFLGLDATQQK